MSARKQKQLPGIAHAPPAPKKTGRGRPGWIREPGYGGQCGARYQLEGTRYFVLHCGHPTANWPYYGVRPDGSMVLAPNGYAFSKLADAQAAIEAIAAGALK